MQIERPKRINDAIQKLLTQGTVEELKTPEGRMLAEFFTADEVARAMELPMGECTGFDGTTCDACRGEYRFRQCQQCHGSHDMLPTVAPQMQKLLNETAEKAQERKTAGMKTSFWQKFIDKVKGNPPGFRYIGGETK